jgi:hypothetical protein
MFNALSWAVYTVIFFRELGKDLRSLTPKALEELVLQLCENPEIMPKKLFNRLSRLNCRCLEFIIEKYNFNPNETKLIRAVLLKKIKQGKPRAQGALEMLKRKKSS